MSDEVAPWGASSDASTERSEDAPWDAGSDASSLDYNDVLGSWDALPGSSLQSDWGGSSSPTSSHSSSGGGGSDDEYQSDSSLSGSWSGSGTEDRHGEPGWWPPGSPDNSSAASESSSASGWTTEFWEDPASDGSASAPWSGSDSRGLHGGERAHRPAAPGGTGPSHAQRAPHGQATSAVQQPAAAAAASAVHAEELQHYAKEERPHSSSSSGTDSAWVSGDAAWSGAASAANGERQLPGAPTVAGAAAMSRPSL